MKNKGFLAIIVVLIGLIYIMISFYSLKDINKEDIDVSKFINVADEISDNKAQINWKYVAAIIGVMEKNDLNNVKEEEMKKVSKLFLNDNNEKENITFNINNLPEFYSVHFPENYSTEVINDCCIIHYNSCRDKDKMEQLISKLKEENNIKNYIIDLRYNGGGSSSVIKPLINFLKDKNIVALVNEYVFSSGRMALVELKKIGAYIIGTDIGTSLNCFGNCPSNLDIDKLNLRVTSSSTYWYYDKELSLTGYEKDEFNTYFNNKKELLEPVLLHPDKYVYLTKEDIINEYDEQKKEAINYFKKIKEVNRIGRKNKR